MQHAAANDTSYANQQTLARLYDAFAQGDVEAVTATLTDDIEWHVNGPAPVAGTYRGHAAVLTFFPRMMAQYEGALQLEVLGILTDEHHGTVRVTEHAGRPGDGVSYSGVHVWEFRAGRCSRFVSLYDDSYAEFWSVHRHQSQRAA